MIRTADTGDRAAIVEVVVAAGLFDRDEVGIVDDLLNNRLFSPDDTGYRCLVDERDEAVTGVAFAEQRAAADRVWELTMLAVQPQDQRSGSGSALVEAIEQQLGELGARLMIVETSATPQYAAARAFYLRIGYDEEARVRDYWTDGDDLVTFRKRLTA